MIYYYSATGNTRYAARLLGSLLNEKTADLLHTETSVLSPDDDEPLGFMFPVYCWGIPPVVRRFLEAVLPQVSAGRYLWAACTCGDEAGTSMRQLNRDIRKIRGREADALWSIIMPNTYVLLPGFDVDSAETEKSKLEKAPERISHISRLIMSRATGVYDVCQGSLPALRSAIFPVFKKWGVNTRWWHVSDACIGCGRCERICPAKNIFMADSRPLWGKRCFSCCACYHCCPVKAISYASFTKNKSQYLCPE